MERESIRSNVLGFLGGLLLRALGATWRWEIRVPKGYGRPLFSSLTTPHIFFFWHGHQLVLPVMFLREGGEKCKMTTLSSRHRDGRLMSVAVRTLGIKSVQGSSTRGGAIGFRNLQRAMEEGSHVSMTPDGPKGPIGQVKPGVITLASLSGGRLLPLTATSSSCWRFKSWDKMMLPKPFSKVVVIAGEPIEVPGELSDEDREKMAKKLEGILHELAREAEQILSISTSAL